MEVSRFSGRAIQEKQSARRAVWKWMLSDLRAGEVVLEV